MKWTHLPVDGGLYDQDPDLLDKFEYMMRMISEQEARERAEQEEKDRKENAKTSRASNRGGRGRRR
jgi:hypothetical protein